MLREVLIISILVKESLLDISPIQQRLCKDKVRTLYYGSSWLKFILLVIFPLNKEVIFAWLPIDSCHNPLDFVKEDGTNSCLALQLVYDEATFIVSPLSLFLNVIEECST